MHFADIYTPDTFALVLARHISALGICSIQYQGLPSERGFGAVCRLVDQTLQRLGPGVLGDAFVPFLRLRNALNPDRLFSTERLRTEFRRACMRHGACYELDGMVRLPALLFHAGEDDEFIRVCTLVFLAAYWDGNILDEKFWLDRAYYLPKLSSYIRTLLVLSRMNSPQTQPAPAA